MSIAATFAVYSLLIVLASLLGGFVPIVIRLTHRRLQIATSLIAGFMLGVALLHLLPHALMGASVTQVVGWMLAGLLTMFFLERFFAYHHHTAAGEEGMPPVTADPEPEADCDHAPGDPIDHHHGHHHHRPHKLSWTGVGFGLVLHSLIAGGALAASMTAEAHGDVHAMLPGLAVALVIILHKPFDSMTLLTLLKSSGRGGVVQHLVNVLFALAVPLGGLAFFLGVRNLEAHDNVVIGAAVAFAAGVFLCVALADLLPEVHFHRHDRVLLSAAVLVGLALAWTIAHFESQSHAHEQGHGLTDDAHHGHGHGEPDPHEGHDHGEPDPHAGHGHE